MDDSSNWDGTSKLILMGSLESTRTHIEAIFASPVDPIARSDSSPVILSQNPSIAYPVLPFVAHITLDTFLSWSDRLLTSYATILDRHITGITNRERN